MILLRALCLTLIAAFLCALALPSCAAKPQPQYGAMEMCGGLAVQHCAGGDVVYSYNPNAGVFRKLEPRTATVSLDVYNADGSRGQPQSVTLTYCATGNWSGFYCTSIPHVSAALPPPEPGFHVCFALPASGGLLYICYSYDGINNCAVYDAQSGTCSDMLTEAVPLAVSPEGDRLLYASSAAPDFACCVYDTKTRQKYEIAASNSYGYFVDEDHIFVCAGGAGVYANYDGSAPQLVRDADFNPAAYSGAWRALHVSDSLSESDTNGGVFSLQNIATGAVVPADLGAEAPQSGEDMALYSSPDGSYAVLSLGGAYYVLDTAKGKAAPLDPARYGSPGDASPPVAWLDSTTLAFNRKVAGTVEPVIINVKKIF